MRLCLRFMEMSCMVERFELRFVRGRWQRPGAGADVGREVRAVVAWLTARRSVPVGSNT